MRYELTDHDWTAIKPFLLNKPRGVPCVIDRRVLNGIFWVLRSWAPGVCATNALPFSDSALSSANPSLIVDILRVSRTCRIYV